MPDFSMPSYTVVLDTNCVFSPKPEYALSEGFLKAIRKIRPLAQVDFLIPEIVMHELAYQQFRTAEQACTNLVKNAATINAATGIESATPPTNDTLRESAKAEVQGALHDAGVTLTSTPYKSIDWQSVVEDSCWRNSTFETPSDEEPMFEKGFRDRIILESVLVALRDLNTDLRAFVSGDKILREAVVERCKSAGITTEIHDSIGSLLEQLQLLNRTKSKGFSKQVSEAISTYFFKPGSEECVFRSCDLAGVLASKFGAEIREPNLFSAYREIEKLEPESRRREVYTGFRQQYDPSKFTLGSGLRFIIGKTHYENGHEDNRFHWRTEIEIACLHQEVVPPGHFRPRRFSWAQIKNIEVHWSCRISTKDGTYSEPAVDKVSETFGKSFEALTGDVRSFLKYDLPPFPSLVADDASQEREMKDRVAFDDCP